MGKVLAFDGIRRGFKHTAPDVHMKILHNMSESRRRWRVSKPSNGVWYGEQILTRVCTKATVTE